MNSNGYAPWVASLVALAGFVVVLMKWRQERNDLKVEHGKRVGVEAELMDIVRRGRAPFLRAVHLALPQRQVEKKDGVRTEIYSADRLAPGDEVVQETVPKDTVILIAVSNDGEAVRAATDDWPQDFGFLFNVDGLHQGDRVTELRYLYDPAKHGQTLRIAITFETMDGLKLSQTYETRHGFCELKRTDPP